jgi:TonB family protein
MPLRTLWLALALALPASAFQEKLPRMDVDEQFLRILASVYPTPEYPKSSIEARHTGRVVVEVLVGPDGNNYTYTRVQSSKVLEAPDPEMAKAVLDALAKARYTLAGPRAGQVATPVGHVVWEFRITDGKPEVIDPYAPKNTPRPRPVITADDLRIVQRARAILSSAAVWNRADTRECPADRKTFSLYCALEKATQEISGAFEHRGIVMEEARAAIDEITHQKDYDHRLMGYNNDPTTTFADIQKVLRATEERISRKLDAKK